MGDACILEDSEAHDEWASILRRALAFPRLGRPVKRFTNFANACVSSTVYAAVQEGHAGMEGLRPKQYHSPRLATFTCSPLKGDDSTFLNGHQHDDLRDYMSCL